MPLFEIKGNINNIPAEKKVSMKDILEMHRMRWDYTCSLGTIRLRRLTLLDQEKTVIRLEREHPDYFKLSERAGQLWHAVDAGGALSPEEQIEMTDLIVKLQPYAHEFSCACFEDPIVNSGEELGHLLFELKTDERQELMDILMTLASSIVDGKLNSVALTLSKEFNIKLTDDLTMENMTASQAVSLIKNMNDRQGDTNG